MPYSDSEQRYPVEPSRRNKDFKQTPIAALFATFIGDLGHLLAILLHEAERAWRRRRSIGLVFHASDCVSSAFLRDLSLFRNRLISHGCVTFLLQLADVITFACEFSYMNSCKSIINNFNIIAIDWIVGSAAFGSLIIAIVQTIRFLLELIEQRLKAAQNQVAVIIMKCDLFLIN